MMNAPLFSSKTDEWATPSRFFAELDAEFHFDLDPCSTDDNAKCKDHYTIEDDGLEQNWGGAESVLQPAIRAQYFKMGSEVLRGIPEARHPRSDAYSGQNGHFLFPRLHIPQGEGNTIHPRTPSFQRGAGRSTISKYDCNFLTNTHYEQIH